jgi:hypothetical protein
MAEKFGGHSRFGKRLNQVVSKTDHLDVDRFKTARAIIYKSYKDLYIFNMKLLDSNGNVVGETNPIPIIGTEDQLAMFYGSPHNMTGGESEVWEVIIFYRGTTVNNGVALVTRRLQELQGGRFEAVTLANELVAKGTSYSPPGSGMM